MLPLKRLALQLPKSWVIPSGMKELAHNAALLKQMIDQWDGFSRTLLNWEGGYWFTKYKTESCLSAYFIVSKGPSNSESEIW